MHLINASALDEFSQAVRSVGGQPDLELRPANPQQGVPLDLWGRLQQDPDIALASPVLELSTYALPADAGGKRMLLRVEGIDTLQVAAVAPDLLPRPLASDDTSDADGAAPDRRAFFAPDTVFLNPMARQELQGNKVRLQMGLQLRTVRVAGSVAAGGRPGWRLFQRCSTRPAVEPGGRGDFWRPRYRCGSPGGSGPGPVGPTTPPRPNP